MEGPLANPDGAGQVPVPIPRREVDDSEYRTSYIDLFQVRLPEGLHGRLTLWAVREDRPPGDFLVDILEEAVRRRGG